MSEVELARSQRLSETISPGAFFPGPVEMTSRQRVSAICAELPPRAGVSQMMLRHLRSIRLRRAKLHLSLLRQLQGVLYLDAEIANRTLELGVAQQELHGAQVLGPPINQRRLCATNGMGSIRRLIKAHFLDPGVDNPSILSGAQMRRPTDAASKERVVRREV
jgi:hypothetical protein